MKLTPEKQTIRREASARRRELADKDAVSEKIIARLLAYHEYQTASVVAYYLDVRDEVRTRFAVPDALKPDAQQSERKIVIPYCVDGELELFHLESMDELSTGKYGILEPRTELRSIDFKRVSVDELDLIIVPGVAFDENGARMGHGKGYYDKLLARAKSSTRFVALAYGCQLFPSVPVEPHDIRMHAVITENRIITIR